MGGSHDNNTHKLMVVVSRGNNNDMQQHELSSSSSNQEVRIGWLCKNVRDQSLILQNVSEKGFSSYTLEIEASVLNWWGHGNEFSQV